MIQTDSETFQMMLHQIMERFDRIEDRLSRMNRQTSALDGDKLLDNQEVCDILRINKKTLQAYRAKGLLPFSRIKNKLFYKPEDIRRLLELSYHPLIKSKL